MFSVQTLTLYSQPTSPVSTALLLANKPPAEAALSPPEAEAPQRPTRAPPTLLPPLLTHSKL